MFDFFDDFFHFLSDDAPDNSTAGSDGATGGESNPIEDAAHDAFDFWQQGTDEFFDGLAAATKDWAPPANDFVSAWQQATESFADQFASWFGWGKDDSPV